MARRCVLLLYFIILVRLGIEDYKTRKIKNRYSLQLLLLSAVSAVVFPEISLGSRLEGMLIVSVPMAVAALIRPGSFGGGDVKLAFACGMFLGCQRVLWGTAVAVGYAAVCSLWLLMRKKGGKDRQFAFGPFLSAGYFFAAMGLF